MSTPKKVATLVGSVRKASLSKKLALHLQSLAPCGLQLEIVDLGNLPLFNPDEEAAPPSQWVSFREQVSRSDAVLFITPEYNRSIPAALKNAIDIGSRPYGQSVWNAKPGAIISLSPGALGAFGANHHLRQSLVFLNVPTLQQPEAYIGNAEKLFDDSGSLVPATQDFAITYLRVFEQWINSNITLPE
ncbi:NADPH-dependent FMN reductase [Paraburkholderia haematera]|uniref:Quinone reductase n=1 Tax=Paraburkholderia haematera TaxID=2793077 RepID=A0ABN7MP32_9BURK|nr:NAD(P)H-dependent oxidoreductase [Paraburkholderia haematera]CAE6809213.1 Quinone reductase [Paraburkholderia haematera]